MRAKYQVLILPWRKLGDQIRYCIFQRRDMDFWQFIAGGGEDEDGSVLASARREAWEEAQIPVNAVYTALESRCSISTEHFGTRVQWGPDCLVIPEYAFAVEVAAGEMKLSNEHTACQWVDYATAQERLRFDSNKVALWELDNKLRMGLI